MYTEISYEDPSSVSGKLDAMCDSENKIPIRHDSSLVNDSTQHHGDSPATPPQTTALDVSSVDHAPETTSSLASASAQGPAVSIHGYIFDAHKLSDLVDHLASQANL